MAKKDKENTTVEVSGNDDKQVKKEKKEKNKSEKKQPNKVAKWFKDLKIEFKKVVWPSKKTVVDNTAVVLAVVVASAVLVGLLDTGFLNLLRLIYQQG
ncbi:MAG: preprotein translocase subunit SecE [Ruminococcus sp.]|nr:preprotein translocase subunit SecE [Ruminococcus sp.]MDE7225819.1 preprotein translocase subunit SecE [Ruminococcus sp.]